MYKQGATEKRRIKTIVTMQSSGEKEVMCLAASQIGSVSVRNVFECVASIQFLFNADTKICNVLDVCHLLLLFIFTLPFKSCSMCHCCREIK